MAQFFRKSKEQVNESSSTCRLWSFGRYSRYKESRFNQGPLFCFSSSHKKSLNFLNHGDSVFFPLSIAIRIILKSPLNLGFLLRAWLIFSSKWLVELVLGRKNRLPQQALYLYCGYMRLVPGCSQKKKPTSFPPNIFASSFSPLFVWASKKPTCSNIFE